MQTIFFDECVVFNQIPAPVERDGHKQLFAFVLLVDSEPLFQLHFQRIEPVFVIGEKIRSFSVVS